MRGSPTLRVLVADDDRLTLDVLAFAALKHEDISLSVAGDLQSALSILRDNEAFDLVLLDVRMPDTQGLRGLEAIRKITKSTPVAFMTGQSEDQLLHEAQDSGASGFILKSQPIGKLIDNIRLMASGGRCFPDHGAPLPLCG